MASEAPTHAGFTPLPDGGHVVDVAKSLCSYRSVSGEERAAADWVAGEMRRLGLQVHLQEVLPGRPNVIAVLDTGRAGPTLLYNGHLDTLPIPAGYTHDPFKSFVREGRCYGAEINNMKGAVAAMIGAMGALRTVADRLCGRIILSTVMGECDSLGLGTLAMIESGLTADFAINGEPTDLQVMTCHVGVTQLRIEASGISVHVCRRREGRSAVTDLLKAISTLDESCLSYTPHSDFPGLPTINIGKIMGGTMASMLAAEAEALVDVRSVPGMTPAGILADVKAAIERTQPRNGRQPDIEVSLLDRPIFCQQHPYQIDGNHPVVRAVAWAHERRFGKAPHIGALYPQVFYGTDASHLNRAGISTTIYGPGKVEQISVADESMAIADMLSAADVYTLAGAQLCART
jgi:acetylornithine deacetylase